MRFFRTQYVESKIDYTGEGVCVVFAHPWGDKGAGAHGHETKATMFRKRYSTFIW